MNGEGTPLQRWSRGLPLLPLRVSFALLALYENPDASPRKPQHVCISVKQTRTLDNLTAMSGSRHPPSAPIFAEEASRPVDQASSCSCQHCNKCDPTPNMSPSVARYCRHGDQSILVVADDRRCKPQLCCLFEPETKRQGAAERPT